MAAEYRRTPEFEKGLDLRRRVLGEAYTDRVVDGGSSDDMARDLQQLANEHVWGQIWSRDGLDLRTRSAVALAILCNLRQNEELALHIEGGFNNGLSVGEIFEIFVHASIYAGMPATLNAVRVLRTILDEKRS